QKSRASFGDHALVYDTVSNLYYFPFFKDSVMYVREFRLENGDTVHNRLERIDYIVGSGQHTNSHILDQNGYIYQAPITYYTQEERWDMAPGFRGDNIRFSRWLSTECITCHNHFPKSITGAMHKYEEMPRGIECERCHGPGEIHVQEKLAGNIVDTSQFIDYSIVNPSNLSRDLQMDLCQRCHLQGIAVLNEGKSFFDFKPGMSLNSVMNVFLPRYTDSHDKFIMASQADRLRLSACFQQSEMTCLTCHNPHQSIEITDRSQYNKTCINCHGGTQNIACNAPIDERQAEQDDCSNCHMPQSGSIDIPHVNITDHYISRSNIKGKKVASTNKEAAFLGLQILTKKTAEPLEMAKGYLALYDKYLPAPMILDSAFYYLNLVKSTSEAYFKTSIHYYFNRQDYAKITSLSQQKVSFKGAWTAYRIGEAFYKSGNLQYALKYYQQATQEMPYHLEFQEKLGTTQIQLQQIPQAIQTLEWIIKEDDTRAVAWCNLGYAYLLQRQVEKAESHYDRAIALDPDYEQALLNKAAVKLLRKEVVAARLLLERVLEINAENRQAKAILGQLE
ncbi:MAG: tetratricopeptide repeat protein, partial [Bacteroidota bacterium]